MTTQNETLLPQDSTLRSLQLAFGEAVARTSGSAELTSEHLRHGYPWVRGVQPSGDPKAYRSRTAALRLDDIRLVAFASMPFQAEVASGAYATVSVPWQGVMHARVESRCYRGEAGVNAFFFPPLCTRSISRPEPSSVLSLHFEPERLERVAGAMLGQREPFPAGLACSADRELPMTVGGVSLHRVLQRLCAMVDALHVDPPSLQALAVDEAFLRALASLLLRDRFDAERAAPVPDPSTTELSRACDFAMERLQQTIRLSDLERAAGLSARSLQYAFQRRFGVSPLQWVRDRRLELAHRRLSRAAPADTVAAIARECGFNRLPTFSQAYAIRFGELPSETLRRTSRH